ncbi:MAG: hypothetical protein JSW60_00505 [Thermoplasmatales archaeon]|nr:MAG: hypothetical protein JSW60_00505 [Thermoplasmatales archaeon]
MQKSLLKKRIVFAITVLLIIVSTLPICYAHTWVERDHKIVDNNIEKGRNSFTIDIHPCEEKKWTFMFYDDADFHRAFDPFNWFAEEAYSSENIDVLVLQDKEWSPAKIWYIDENHDKNLVRRMGEVNMGDPLILQNFIEICKDEYPAERYIIAFYDHGMGWEGACIDETSDDYLTMDEMQCAFAATGGVDVVCFTAPCRMGAVESAYELRECTAVYIGSEEGSGYAWWGNVIGDICDSLNQKPNQSVFELGIEIIELVEEHSYEWPQWRDNLTMSAVRSDKLENLGIAINTLSLDFVNDYPALYDLVWSAYENTLSFGAGYGVDIYDFAQECAKVITNQTIVKDLHNVQKNVSEAVIAECHGDNKAMAHGLSVYLPDPNSSWWHYDLMYSFCGLDFTDDTYWDEFLITYLNISNETTVVTIDKPQKAFYINNNKIFSPFITIIIGDVDIKVTAADLDGIDRVEFYLDNKYKYNDTTYPYIWRWDKKQLFKFRYSLKVVAFDNYGNKTYDEIKVWRLF